VPAEREDAAVAVAIAQQRSEPHQGTDGISPTARGRGGRGPLGLVFEGFATDRPKGIGMTPSYRFQEPESV
jgi:hypothetical protein